jgi:phospholipase C
VGAGDELGGEWDVRADGGAYDLWVLGPNGFHRHFTGDLGPRQKPAAEPEVRVDYDTRRGGLRLSLRNRGHVHCTFRVLSNAYQHRWEPLVVRVGAHEDGDHFLALHHTANWYDFTVLVVGLDAYSRRLAGHMETGRHSLSDPGLGGRARGQHT